MTVLNTYFAECDRLDDVLSRRPTAQDEQAASPNVRVAFAVAAACFAAFGLAAVLL